MSFTESPETDQGLPLWMECTIHRSDRVIPTTVREYLAEVMYESDIWKKMPRRMLRHRVLQQCARLTMGIRLQESQKETQGQEVKHQALPAQENTGSKSEMITDNSLSGVRGLKMRLMN